nr:MAG TPA: hypothetical protein [Caudoviricetes sp.]
MLLMYTPKGDLVYSLFLLYHRRKVEVKFR